ncbi:MAG: response regulator [Desulfomonilaceae bacterium]|nr:response regulator [Desulfomonilaceae bacterium]
MSPRILLVDDNEDFLDNIKDVFEDEGYEVLTATSGEGAVQLVKDRPVDVVVMDIKMPGMNGVEAFIEMKKFKPGVKVIMCTAYIVEATIRRALSEGAQAVLNKPFEMEVLFRTVETVLEGGPPCNVLVADRDEEFCNRLGQCLRAHGYQAVTAVYGPEAVTKAGEASFDVLVLDKGLPLLDGLEVYDRIKKMQPNLVAAIITGNAHEMDSRTLRDLRRKPGVVTMKKPFDETELIHLLQDLCFTERQG